MTSRRSPARTPCPPDSSSAPRSCCSLPRAFPHGQWRPSSTSLDRPSPSGAGGFLEHGVEGLTNRHRGRPRWKLMVRLRARVLAATRRPPPDGTTHWSCRRLAAAPRRGKEHRAAGLARGGRAAPPAGPLHGAERPRPRDEGRRHHRSLAVRPAAVFCIDVWSTSAPAIRVWNHESYRFVRERQPGIPSAISRGASADVQSCSGKEPGS